MGEKVFPQLRFDANEQDKRTPKHTPESADPRDVAYTCAMDTDPAGENLMAQYAGEHYDQLVLFADIPYAEVRDILERSRVVTFEPESVVIQPGSRFTPGTRLPSVTPVAAKITSSVTISSRL